MYVFLIFMTYLTLKRQMSNGLLSIDNLTVLKTQVFPYYDCEKHAKTHIIVFLFLIIV